MKREREIDDHQKWEKIKRKYKSGNEGILVKVYRSASSNRKVSK